MKKIVIKILALWTCIAISACESELERLPLDQLTIPTTFTTYENVQTYAWSFYDVFGTYQAGRFDKDEHSADLMLDGRSTDGDPWIWQRIVIPTTSGNWTGPYENIRRVNIMLDNIDNSQMEQADIEHWRSVGYFFRSLSYFGLLSRYGGVVWVENAIDDSDTDVLFGPRASRDVIAQNILEDLQFAEQNIKEEGEGQGSNSIGVHAVRVLISRFGLFEGTWRKYHGLGGETPYLQASASAAERLMADFPSLVDNYDLIYNSQDLEGVPGIILYKAHVLDQVIHPLNQWTRSSEVPFWDFTKAAADMYLCTDGRPRSTSAVFDGDQDPYDEFRNRDRRMYYTITPPYEVVGQVGGDITAWEHTGNPLDREYIDLMATISDPVQKSLPENNWAGFIQPVSPNWRYAGNPNGVPFDPGYNVTSTGYKQFKYYSNLKVNNPWNDEHDEPVYRMGEILVNYAEAKFELGEFDQAVADASINLLRARAGMPAMAVAEINAGFDPDRDPTVDPVLFEIRRERAVELMADGFRFNDLRRWKKMEYATRKKLGRWVDSNDLNSDTVPIEGGASAGYVSLKENDATPPAFPDYYYLYPIPSNEIVLNPQIDQNPGWL
ncbi:MAG: RagB/SusD family nutrient uptake outer membrane protein [Cytophagales bacterium]|nr:RagB/SusD family nutrient uptake outer membrane protein [Cytophagales bacterium]